MKRNEHLRTFQKHSQSSTVMLKNCKLDSTFRSKTKVNIVQGHPIGTVVTFNILFYFSMPIE